MEIAVIGGSGFLGSHLLDELRSRNCSIRQIKSGSSRSSPPNKLVEHNLVENNLVQKKVLHVSFEDQSQLQTALAGCDAIAYLSGINRERHQGDFQKVHVDNLQQVIMAAEKNSIKDWFTRAS